MKNMLVIVSHRWRGGTGGSRILRNRGHDSPSVPPSLPFYPSMSCYSRPLLSFHDRSRSAPPKIQLEGQRKHCKQSPDRALATKAIWHIWSQGQASGDKDKVLPYPLNFFLQNFALWMNSRPIPTGIPKRGSARGISGVWPPLNPHTIWWAASCN